MLRIVFVVATALALTGCAGTESATQAAFRAAHAECTSLGAKPGTDAYAESGWLSISARPMRSWLPKQRGSRRVRDHDKRHSP
jgi:hypothetical protein